MKKREQMRTSNAKAREFLFGEGFDFIWFKSHVNTKFKKNRDYFYTADGKAHSCQDPYNLFDACGYDSEGIFWWFQIKTNNWPSEQELKAFTIGKMGCCIMALNVRTPSTKHRTYRVQTREYEDGKRMD